jgi:bacterioferritin-associated ferredoxin
VFVCHCAVVTDREVVASLASGARTVADVCRETAAGRGCGRCVPTLKALVCQHCPALETSTTEVARATG